LRSDEAIKWIEARVFLFKEKEEEKKRRERERERESERTDIVIIS